MNDQRYPHIFSPIKIGKGGLVFKNRIWTAPTTMHLLGAGLEYPNDAVIAHYKDKARGGAACINFACQNIDRLDGNSDPNIYNERYHEQWRKLTSAVQSYGARISLELLAFSRHAIDERGRVVSYSPSGGLQPMIPKHEIEKMADEFAEAAFHAKNTGFDMVMLHFGHGVFVSQFLSPKYNQRTDEFGGSAENRARFPVMIIDKIREKVGPLFPIEVRLSGSELTAGGGEIEDCVGFIKMVEDKIDIAHVSCGTFMERVSQTIMHPVVFYKPGVNAKHARQVKEAGVKIPVLTIGAFQKPQLIEEILATGGADIVAMARGTIADANCVNKAENGREDEIIPCIKCFLCLAYTTEKEFGCSVNPRVGRERMFGPDITVAAQRKKVIVVGGGPAGLAAAFYSAKRGHDVTLFERENQLGGKLVFARHVDFKYDMKHFLEYLLHSVEKAGVKVRTGVTATKELISAENADVVLAALGSDPAALTVPGAARDNVIFAEQCFGNPEAVGNKVVVIGGGLVGSETALHLAMECGRHVSIIEQRRALAYDANNAPFIAINHLAMEHCDVYLNAKCGEITEGGVTCILPSSKKCFIEADTVVVSTGMVPRVREAEEFRGCAPVFFKVGDCLDAGSIRICTRTAFDAAMKI